MSMNQIPCSRHVIELEKLCTLGLPHIIVAQINQKLSDGDKEEAFEVLIKGCEINFLPVPESLFYLTDEDFSQELEVGVWYVTFDENDLYVRTPSPKMNKMMKLGLKPERQYWTILA